MLITLLILGIAPLPEPMKNIFQQPRTPSLCRSKHVGNILYIATPDSKDISKDKLIIYKNQDMHALVTGVT